jgi:hypothetical protein
MIRSATSAAVGLALLASCANYAAPPMHEARAVGFRLPLPVFDLDAEGNVSVPPVGAFTYDLDMSPSGYGVDYEVSISDEGELTWNTGQLFAKWKVDTTGVTFDADALMLTTGPRYYFLIDSEWQPFLGASLSYSPELDMDGNDYGSFATVNMGGGISWFPSMNFSVQLGLDWVETIAEPDYNTLQFSGTSLVSVKDEISFNGLQVWFGGSYWF